MLEKPFLKPLLTLLSGTAAGQMIGLLAAPVLTRLYGPADFAVMTAFVGLSTILSIFATLRYDLALLLPRDERAAGAVFQLVILVLAVTTLITGLLLWLFGSSLALAIPTLAAIGSLMPLVPVMMAATAGSQILSAWANRQRAYRVMAVNGVLNQGSNVAIASAMGWSKALGGGLVAGRLVGQVGSAIWLAIHLRASLPRLGVHFSELAAVARRYRQFPFFNVPYSLLGALSQEFLVFALLAYQQPDIAGNFALVRAVLLLPARYLSSSLGLAFFREAAQLFGTPALEALTLKLMYQIGVVVAPLTVAFMFWSEQVFVLVFGESWRLAGQIASWYGPVGFLFLFTSWPERLYEVSERQAVSLGIEFGGNIVKLAAVLFPLSMGASPFIAIIAYAVADALYHVAYLLGLFHVGKFRIFRLVYLAGTLSVTVMASIAGCTLLLLTPLPWIAQAAAGVCWAATVGAYATIDLHKKPL